MTSLDLDAIRARLEAASPGPWEDGEHWQVAGVLPDLFGDGQCTFCRQSEPAWRGRADINGKVMDAHRHRMPEPYGAGWRIATALGVVAEEVARPEDQSFIWHSREDVPALIAEIERLRARLSAESTEVS